MSRPLLPDWLWFTLVIGGVIVAVVALLAAIGAGVYAIDSRACSRDAERLNLSHDYDFWASGCYVEVDGHMVPLDNVRITDEGEVLAQ